MARIVAILVVAALAVLPATAPAASSGAAQQSQQLLQDTATQQQPAPAPTTPAQQTEANSGSISRGELLLVVLGIAALIGGIWFVIARDARRVTGGRTRTADGALARERGGSPTRAGRRSRRLSAEERKRRKRGRAH
jgi:hypothetical protein